VRRDGVAGAGGGGVRVVVLLGVDAGQGLLVEVGALAAILNPGLVIDADDVQVLVVGHREAGVGQETSGDGVGRQLLVAGALETDDGLALALKNATRCM
jgi:hypothetical protein